MSAVGTSPGRVAGEGVRPRLSLIFPSGHFFNTPCVPNLALSLADTGWDVDVFLVRNTAAPPGRLDHPRLRLHVFPAEIHRAQEPVAGLTVAFAAWLLPQLRARQSILVAVGVRGLFVTGILARMLGEPFIYNSLEIYADPRFRRGRRRAFKWVESLLNRRAAFTIIQDEERAEILSRVNGLGIQDCLIFPNAPLPAGAEEPYDPVNAPEAIAAAVEARAAGRRILSYSGSLAEWGNVGALPRVAAGLPDPWLLIVQSRMRATAGEIPPGVSDRFRVNAEPLTVADYHRFVRLSDAGLAWYHPSDPNLRYVGLSSGKIAQYWALGKPVIVNRLPLFEDVLREFRSGVTVDSPQEIPAAVETIASDYQAYEAGASAAFDALFDMPAYAREIDAALECLSRTEVGP
jgi:glycosyltransferase involved in cell wall biosynthesis